MALDPISALSSASCCAQFVDYTSLMISGSAEICQSSDGELIDHNHLQTVANRLLVLSNDIQVPDRVSPRARVVSIEQKLAELCEECGNISGQLLSALIMLQFHGRKERWPSVRHALRSLWNQEQIDSLQKQLDHFRNRLVVDILASLRQAVISVPFPSAEKPIARAAYDPSKICIEFLNCIEESKRWRADLITEIHRTHSQASNSTIVANFANSTLSSSKEKIPDFAALILANLWFPEMEERCERIVKAHHKTFEWLYHDPMVNFGRWLQMESTHYWITGSPGSGKSTLMKFIREDQRTQDCLTKWAAPKKLVTAAFFFWKTGTQLQMSQTGLLQSLLFEVLSQCQDLVARVFPAHWEAYVLFGGPINEHWTDRELEDAFKRLLEQTSSTVRLCLWIDGMDECRGDPVDLIGLFTNILHSPHQVKLCVSSRPWVVFEAAFGQFRKLSLQDLTRPDIQHFVASRLCTHPIFHQMQQREPQCAIQLRDGIVLKASGVFLWVELVLRSLLAGLTYGDRISDLKRRLDSLPPELDDLIMKILSSLDSFYFEQAAQLFQLVRASLSPPTLLSLYLADEEKPGFYAQCEKRFLTYEEMGFRVETMRRRITSRCKGLLEMAPNSQALTRRPSLDNAKRLQIKEDLLLSNLKVKYMHRTVQDLLERADNWEKFTAATGKSFSPNEALCKSFIVQLKVLHPRYLMPHSFWHIIALCIEHYARAERESGITQVHVLDELDSAATAWSQLSGPFGHTFVQLFWRTEAGAKYHWTSTFETGWSRSVGGPASSTFLAFAVRCQLYSYVQAKLRDGSSEMASSLLYTAVNDYQINLQHAPSCQLSRPDVKLVALLLAHGADTNALFRGMSAWERVLEHSSTACPEDDALWQAIRNLFIRYGADMEKAPYLKEIHYQQRLSFPHKSYPDDQQLRPACRQSSTPNNIIPPMPGSKSSSEARASSLPSWSSFGNVIDLTTALVVDPCPSEISTGVTTQPGITNQLGSPATQPLRARVHKRVRIRVRKSPSTKNQTRTSD